MAYKRISPAPVAEGGTGNTSLTAYAVTCGGTTSTGAIQSIAGVGNAGQILTSNGAAALPTFQAAPATGIGTLNGDTGSATGATVTIRANVSSGSTVSFTGSAAIVDLAVTTPILYNTTIGHAAGNGTISGDENTSLGDNTLHALTSGQRNTAIGRNAAKLVTTGVSNSAFGVDALSSLDTGSSNIAVGHLAGSSYTTSEHSNIIIGNTGTITDSHIIRIGTTGSGSGQQDNCYIAGITGVNVGSVATVVSHSTDHLGSTTITAGAGISVTPGANTITIANTGGTGFTWAVTTVNAGMVVANGYIANKAGLLTMTLPATAAIGDILEITNMNTAVGWRIAQNANQYIRFGTLTTTVGVGGYLEATQLGDSVKFVCKVAGASTGWQTVSSMGNITIV